VRAGHSTAHELDMNTSADQRAAMNAVPLEAIDVSRPERLWNDTWHAWFVRLRREAPVHYLADSAHAAFWLARIISSRRSTPITRCFSRKRVARDLGPRSRRQRAAPGSSTINATIGCSSSGRSPMPWLSTTSCGCRFGTMACVLKGLVYEILTILYYALRSRAWTVGQGGDWTCTRLRGTDRPQL
jgi:hypothetical protein